MNEPFSRRTLWILVGLGVASFAFAIFVSVFGDEMGGVPSAGPDSYSRSALGHKAFVQLLEAYGLRVLRSRHDSGVRAGEHAPLVIAEPRVGTDEQKATLTRMLAFAHEVLVVLPKRTGYPDPDKRAWINEAALVPEEQVKDVLAALHLDAELVRPAQAQTFHGQGDFPDGVALTQPQLLRFPEDAELEPLVESEAGVLAARVTLNGTDVIVVADPDLIANHGLGDGENAALALRAVDELLSEGGKEVVLDETLHGHVSTPSLWRELFEFPLSLATATVLFALALLLWAAMGRFGKPLPPERALGAGKGFLIDNTAELTRYGGHAAHALERYLHAAVQEVARASHAPAHLGPAELREWLLRAAHARKVESDLVALEREVAEVAAAPPKAPRLAARALATAGRIHRWRQEMTDGSAGPGRAS
jgi:hypothetical protein